MEAAEASLKYKQGIEGDISSRAEKQSKARKKLVIEGVTLDPGPYVEAWQNCQVGEIIPKTGKGKYDREHQLGKKKQKNPRRTKAESAKRCKAQGKKYLSLKTGLIRGANLVIISMRLHCN